MDWDLGREAEQMGKAEIPGSTAKQAKLFWPTLWSADGSFGSSEFLVEGTFISASAIPLRGNKQAERKLYRQVFKRWGEKTDFGVAVKSQQTDEVTY